MHSDNLQINNAHKQLTAFHEEIRQSQGMQVKGGSIINDRTEKAS